MKMIHLIIPLVIVCVLITGCSDTYLFVTGGNSSNSSSSNFTYSDYFNQPLNTTSNQTANKYSTNDWSNVSIIKSQISDLGIINNIINNSYQCSGTDQLYNVSINSTGHLNGVCSAQGSGSGSTTTVLNGISNKTYDASVLEEENYFNSPFIGWGCYENWLLQSESFGTTWTRLFTTAITNDNAVSPIGTVIAENMLGNSSSGTNRSQVYQTVTNTAINNVTFSVWVRTYLNKNPNATIHLWLHSNNDTLYPQQIYDINITPYWNRYNITINYNFSHTIKNITIINDEINISLWGAQLENGTRATINGAPRTTSGQMTQICGGYTRSPWIFQSSVSAVGISAGGSISGASTIANTGTQTCTYASTLNTLSLYGLALTSGASTSAIPFQGAPMISFRSTLWDGAATTNQEYNFGTQGDNLTKTTNLILFNKNALNKSITIMNITTTTNLTIPITNITLPFLNGTGNAVLCLNSIGTIYRGNGTGCP